MFEKPQQTGPAPEQPPRTKARRQGAQPAQPQVASQAPEVQKAAGQVNNPAAPSADYPKQNPANDISDYPTDNPAYQISDYPMNNPAHGISGSQPVPGYMPGNQGAAYQGAPQVVYAAPPEQKKSRSWIVAVVMIVCVFAFTAFCVKTCSDTVSKASLAGTTSGAPGGNSVAVITLSGTIQYDGSACSPEGLKELLDQAADDDGVKAVVLRVDSGGGTATAGEEMATYVSQFKKPIVVSSASINASAAYEISSRADYIFVAKSTEIGAIGTAMQLTDLSGLLDMLGVNMEVITSADEKDSSYGYRPLTDQERAEYQHMVDQINDVFIQNVAEGRGMTVDEVRALATGMPFTGIDAVQNKLADEIGTLEDAADKAASLAGVEDYTLFDLDFYSYDLTSLYDLLGSSSTGSQRIASPVLKQ